MRPLRLRLPPWTTHPGFGVAVLVLLAATLIAHGEPQPSSRPSGTSVGVSGTASAPSSIPSLLVVVGRRVQLRQGSSVRTVTLPAAAVPRAVVAGRGAAVVLADVNGRQRAYEVGSDLVAHDLGYADAALPAAAGTAAIVIEAALTDPGRIAQPASTDSPSPTSSSPTPSSTVSGAVPGQPVLRDFVARRYDRSGHQVGVPITLPIGTRAATDTAVGLVVWQPVNRVFDKGLPLESLSSRAVLIRPDDSLRELGPVHPLAADGKNLLVWDVSLHRFGIMPLRYVTATTTVTATPTSSATPTTSRGSDPTASPTPSASPSTVAGVRWFQPTRGMILVTGPASFNSTGSAFAVYAQVGTRRRLVVAELQNAGTDQVEVLALAAPPVKPSKSATVSGTAGTGLVTPSVSSGSPTPTPTPTSSASALEPDGYPIPAPLTPTWWNDMVVGVGLDGTVIGYRPGGVQSSLLDLGVTDLTALALAP